MANKTPGDEVTFTGTRTFMRFNSGPERRRQSANSPWLLRRYKPYVKTPKTGRTSRKIPRSEDLDVRTKSTSSNSGIAGSKQKHTQGQKDSSSNGKTDYQLLKAPFQDLISKTLRVYHASPLYNFNCDSTSLRHYGNQLSRHLELESEKESLFASHSDKTDGKYKADISFLQGISAEHSNSSAVRIVVSSTTKNQGSKQFAPPVLTFVACSVGNTTMEDDNLRDYFTSLPVCLFKGPAILARSLISWLEVRFDCRITPMTFSSMDLSWFFSLWAGLASLGSKSVPIELCYGDLSAKGLKQILFSINEKDARGIWEGIHDANSPVFTEEESLTFMKVLELHFYHHFKIRLSALPLTRIKTTVACIGSEGRLKIVHPQLADHIIEQITQFALAKEFYGRL